MYLNGLILLKTLKVSTTMKLTPKEIEDLVASVVGRDALALLRLLIKKKNFSEFKLAEKLKLNINQVRNVLYRMSEHNLVSFTRKKDKVKGWYIYYWTFDERQAKNLFLFRKRNRLAELKKVLNEKKEEETFFVCKTDFIKFNVNEALESDFKCPECGKVLSEEKVMIDFEKIRKEIAALELEISSFAEKPFVARPQKAAKKASIAAKAKKKSRPKSKVIKKSR